MPPARSPRPCLAPWLGKSSGPTRRGRLESSALPTSGLASELEEQHRFSFWDALIVAAALKGGAVTILTEDLSSGRSISGVRIENPFAAPR